MSSNVKKRCDCGAAKWPKCEHPWYLKKFQWKGENHRPNLTRLAATANKTIETKTEAEAFAETVRSAIRLGEYKSSKTIHRTVAPPTGAADLLLGRPHADADSTDGTGALAMFDADVLKTDTHKRPRTAKSDRACLRKFSEFEPDAKRGALATWRLAEITVDVLLQFRRSPVLAGRANSTWAKYRTMIALMFDWATANGHAAANPFKSLQPYQKKALKRGKAARRSRRVDVVEEANLIRAAGRSLHDHVAIRLASLIVCAIESGLRLGELLALTWRDVDRINRTIHVAAREVGASKTGQRPVPMSQRFHDELEMLITDPTGEQFGPRCYVFGDAVGGRVKSIKKAWASAVLHAHGVTPQWTKSGGSLSAASRAELKRIDLHFHDLRHEAGSRWLETKLFDLGEIQAIYGHTAVAQTSTYLHVSTGSAMRAMQRLDAARAELAKAERLTAAAAQNGGRSGHKRDTNAKNGDRATAGPRLVKTDKLRGGV